MSTKVFIGVFCGFALVAQLLAQEVVIVREKAPKIPKAEAVAPKPAITEFHVEKAIPVQPVKVTVPGAKPSADKPATTAQHQKPAPVPQGPTIEIGTKPATTAQVPVKKPAPVPQAPTIEIGAKPAITAQAPAKKPAPVPQAPAIEIGTKPATTAQVPAKKPASVPQAPTFEIGTAKVTTPASPEVKPPKAETTHASVALSPTVPKPAVAEPVPSKPAAPGLASSAPSKPAAEPPVSSASNKPPTALTVGSAPAKLNRDTERVLAQPLNLGGATAFTKLANGFDFPIGKPDAQGYYKARGFQTRGHMGEDWDGTGGGDTDMGDPVSSIGDGIVVFARDCHQGWGNVVIVRHAYREGGSVRNIDALYAHCQKLLVRRGQTVSRGQQIAAIGNAHGLYDAHLHFEIRKNIAIGMSREKFAKDLSNYSDPTQFIMAHRRLQSAGGNYRVAINTFTNDEKIRWDKLRNYSNARTGGGSSQSARALKKALAAQNLSNRTN